MDMAYLKTLFQFLLNRLRNIKRMSVRTACNMCKILVRYLLNVMSRVLPLYQPAQCFLNSHVV